MSHAYATTPATSAFHEPVEYGEPFPFGLIDAVIAAGAFAAWADGTVHPVERLEMLVYMRRAGLAALRRRDVLEIFDQRVRALQHNPPTAMQATLDLLGNFSGSSLAWTVLRAAERVAEADARVQDSEVMAIRSVRAALGLPCEPEEPLPA